MYSDKVIGLKLRDIRNSMKLSQQAVANNLHMTRASISNIENGSQALSLRLFVQICNELHQDPGLFLVDFFTIRPEALQKLTARDVQNVTIRNSINKLLLDKEGEVK